MRCLSRGDRAFYPFPALYEGQPSDVSCTAACRRRGAARLSRRGPPSPEGFRPQSPATAGDRPAATPRQQGECLPAQDPDAPAVLFFGGGAQGGPRVDRHSPANGAGADVRRVPGAPALGFSYNSLRGSGAAVATPPIAAEPGSRQDHRLRGVGVSSLATRQTGSLSCRRSSPFSPSAPPSICAGTAVAADAEAGAMAAARLDRVPALARRSSGTFDALPEDAGRTRGAHAAP